MDDETFGPASGGCPSPVIGGAGCAQHSCPGLTAWFCCRWRRRFRWSHHPRGGCAGSCLCAPSGASFGLPTQPAPRAVCRPASMPATIHSLVRQEAEQVAWTALSRWVQGHSDRAPACAAVAPVWHDPHLAAMHGALQEGLEAPPAEDGLLLEDEDEALEHGLWDEEGGQLGSVG